MPAHSRSPLALSAEIKAPDNSVAGTGAHSKRRGRRSNPLLGGAAARGAARLAEGKAARDAGPLVSSSKSGRDAGGEGDGVAKSVGAGGGGGGGSGSAAAGEDGTRDKTAGAKPEGAPPAVGGSANGGVWAAQRDAPGAPGVCGAVFGDGDACGAFGGAGSRVSAGSGVSGGSGSGVGDGYLAPRITFLISSR